MTSPSPSSGQPQDQTTCQRCGTCCRKGGPTLHAEERELVEQGVIPLADLFTIRQGEMAFDNVRDQLVPVNRDHIKIRGRADTWTCRYFDDEQKGCTIYDQRPLECRILKCWDTHEIERIYGRDLLSRSDLLGGIDGLWDLVSDHQNRCNYGNARELIRRLDADKHGRARQELLEMVQYDIEIRRLVTRSGSVGDGILDFILGRPMSGLLKAEGLNLQPRLEKTGE